MRKSNDFFRKYQHKQKQNSITAKLKMKFRYSPSFQTQKCHSKLPLRFNYNHQSKQNNKLYQHNQHIFSNQPNQINKYNQHNQHNQHNPIKSNQIDCQYSSVKEKFIQYNQCNDTSSWIAKLVYGIQDQDQKNLHKLSQIQARSASDLPEDSHDYGDNQFLALQGHKLFPQTNINPIITNNINTLTYKNKHSNQTQKKSTKLDKIEIQFKQNKDGLKGPPATRVNSCTKRQTQKLTKVKSNQKKQVKKTLPARIRQQRKNEILADQSTQKKSKDVFITKSQTKSKINKSVQNNKLNKQNDNQIKKDCSTNTTLVSSQQIKRQNKKIKNIETDSHAPTRKNSLYYCSRQDQSKSIKQSQQNQQNNKSDIKIFKRPNLFTENCDEQINATKQASQNKILDSFQSTPVELTFLSNKKIGAIKKNIIRKSKQQIVQIVQSKQVMTPFSKSPPQCSSIQQIKQKYNYLPQTNKQGNSIKAKQMNDCNISQNPARNIQQTSLTSFRSICVSESQTTQIIKALFNKIKLDPNNNILSKSNLKLRILNIQEKQQIGTIIAKIHYQNQDYDFKMFQQEYRQVNSQCTLKGCFSKKKLIPNYVQEQKELSFHKDNPRQQVAIKEINSQNINLQKSHWTHQRKSSNLIKRNLFHKDKQTSADKIINQISNDKINKICKNPYIQQSTLSQIDIHSARWNQNTQIVAINSHCVIEKLNDKLNTYIDKNKLANTYRQFNLNFSQLKKHIR